MELLRPFARTYTCGLLLLQARGSTLQGCGTPMEEGGLVRDEEEGTAEVGLCALRRRFEAKAQAIYSADLFLGKKKRFVKRAEHLFSANKP